MTEQSTVPEPDNPKPLRILAAEDEPAVKSLLEAILSREHSIDLVTSVPDALQKLEEAHSQGIEYDLLITDRGLEGPKDGFDLVHEMNEKGLGSNTYVVMLSGNDVQIAQDNPGNMLAEKGIHRLVGKGQSIIGPIKEIVVQVREWQAQQGK